MRTEGGEDGGREVCIARMCRGELSSRWKKSAERTGWNFMVVELRSVDFV